jgi:hypothetical protein
MVVPTGKAMWKLEANVGVLCMLTPSVRCGPQKQQPFGGITFGGAQATVGARGKGLGRGTC